MHRAAGRRRSRVWTACLLVAIPAGAVLGVGGGAGGAPPDQAPLLFVLRGQATTRGATLRIVTDSAEWFTERPERRAGTMSSKQLVKRWESWGFATDPPNAAITGTDLDAVVELADPAATGSRISFEATPVRGELPSGPLGRVSMFVDATDSVGADCAALQASKSVAVATAQLELAGCDLSGADLSGVNLADADLEGANLSGADLSGAQLEGAFAPSADVSGASFSGATMYATNLGGADASDADFSDALLGSAQLADANLRGANLRGANLEDTDLRGADLTGADLTGAVSFGGANATWDDTTCPDGTSSDDDGGHC